MDARTAFDREPRRERRAGAVERVPLRERRWFRVGALIVFASWVGGCIYLVARLV